MKDGTVGKQAIRAMYSDITCGEPCWHAKDSVCRCSCGGKNHGCLLVAGAPAPLRTAKIDGARYELVRVGRLADVGVEAVEGCRRGWKAIHEMVGDHG